MTAELLSDDVFVRSFLDSNRAALLRSATMVTDCLDRLHVPYYRPTSGMFIWLNLSCLMVEGNGWEAEEQV